MCRPTWADVKHSEYRFFCVCRKLYCYKKNKGAPMDHATKHYFRFSQFTVPPSQLYDLNPTPYVPLVLLSIQATWFIFLTQPTISSPPPPACPLPHAWQVPLPSSHWGCHCRLSRARGLSNPTHLQRGHGSPSSARLRPSRFWWGFAPLSGKVICKSMQLRSN